MRILIVDDEALAREAVRLALGGLADVEVVGEARDGLEAVAAIEALAPDLVFLDVQMPGVSGVEALLAMAPERRPGVVFVTAHEQFAIRAFELDAVDYVLKPFDDERIRAALDRARRRMDAPAPAERPDAAQLELVLRRLAGRDAGDRWQQRFLAGSGGKLRLIRASEVAWIEAEDNYVRLHTAGGGALVRDTMKRLEERLDPERFVRVHRSAIVAIAQVRELRPLPSGDYDVVLANGATVTLSRGYRDEALRRLGS